MDKGVKIYFDKEADYIEILFHIPCIESYTRKEVIKDTTVSLKLIHHL